MRRRRALTTLACLAATVALWSSAYADVQRFSVRAEARELEVNTKTDVRVVIEAAEGHAIDPEYPAELHFVPEVGDEVLATKRSRLGRKDASYAEDGKSLSWTLEVTGRRVGEHPARMKMRFSVCEQDGKCHDEKSELRMKIVVKG
jgi:hypothetical protein